MRETGRRIWHIISGIVIVTLIYFDIIGKFFIVGLIIAALILSFISRKVKIPIFYPLLKFLDNKEDLKSFPGKTAIFYAAGILIVLVLFKKDIALASITILALGDSIAPLIGRYGKIKYPFDKKKTVEGILAGLLAGFLGAIIFVIWYEALIAAFFAISVESFGIKLKKYMLNDNITMPFVAGAVIWLLRLVI